MVKEMSHKYPTAFVNASGGTIGMLVCDGAAGAPHDKNVLSS